MTELVAKSSTQCESNSMTAPSSEQPYILIVEDDEQLANLLMEYLSQHGFKLAHESTGPLGAQSILKTNPDLVILDLMLAGANGLDVCRQVRTQFTGAILMLTASQSEADHVAGLELGADDFVNKPIDPRVLLARIRAQLRRLDRGFLATSAPANRLKIGQLELDSVTQETSFDGQIAPLTSMEFDILWLLSCEVDTVVKREDLYQRVLRTEYDGIDRGMDVHVSRIRRKLRSCGFEPTRLKSVRGIGYLMTSR